MLVGAVSFPWRPGAGRKRLTTVPIALAVPKTKPTAAPRSLAVGTPAGVFCKPPTLETQMLSRQIEDLHACVLRVLCYVQTNDRVPMFPPEREREKPMKQGCQEEKHTEHGCHSHRSSHCLNVPY
jgi:hypothetical protein